MKLTQQRKVSHLSAADKARLTAAFPLPGSAAGPSDAGGSGGDLSSAAAALVALPVGKGRQPASSAAWQSFCLGPAGVRRRTVATGASHATTSALGGGSATATAVSDPHEEDEEEDEEAEAEEAEGDGHDEHDVEPPSDGFAPEYQSEPDVETVADAPSDPSPNHRDDLAEEASAHRGQPPTLSILTRMDSVTRPV